MAHRFSELEREAAQLAAARWGLLDPCPADVMAGIYGERWMEENPGLASLITSYAIGGEDG